MTTPSPPFDPQAQPSKPSTGATNSAAASIEQNRLAALARREQNLKSKAEAQARLQAQQQGGLNGGGGENASGGSGGGGNGGKNGGAVSF